MNKIHLDTDLGGDIDDLCALAMLLRWEGVELTGITTVAEANGRRAGYVRYVLELENRTDIPVAAGADVTQGYYRYPELGYPDEEQYWSHLIPPMPGDLDAALKLLKRSIDQGSTIIVIGPSTNLYLLELKYPEILMNARIFLMGGYIYPIQAGFPNWGNEYDWNIQVDVRSAKYVIEHSNPVLIPLTVTVETALQRSHLEEIRHSGALGQLLAGQAEAFALDEQNEKRFGETCEGVPNDIINFLHDPLACAIALGWGAGVEMQTLSLTLEEKEGWLHEKIESHGRPTRVITKIDGPRFNKFWFEKITKGRIKNMNNNRFQIITPNDLPDYRNQAGDIAEASWPEFMLHDPIAIEHWHELFDRFNEYQFALLDTENNRMAAMGNSVPFHWDGVLEELPEGGWDWVFLQAIEDHKNHVTPNIQSAIQINIHPSYQSQGLSSMMVQAMRGIAKSKGFKHLVAPVRPNQKSKYPLTNIDEYIKWTNDEGQPFDAWLRVHARAGARIIKPCHEAMTIRGTRTEWESWTGLKFPQSGKYHIPGALNPMEMDVEKDEGIYIEPNVWMVHEVG